MRYKMLISMFTVLLFAVGKSYLQFDNPTAGFGFAVGGARGDMCNKEASQEIA